MLFAVVAALMGCAKQESGQRLRPAVVLKSAPGEFLAYEHDVTLRLDAERIAARVQTLQEACMRKQHGDCTVLEVSQHGGDYPRGTLTVRIVPAGVEPLIAAASEGADLGARSTHAEDLAEAVRDNALTRSRLQKELSGLRAFQQRRDLSVTDMIALSQQVSKLEAQVEAADQEAAQQRRRIQTQKVSLHFEAPGGRERSRRDSPGSARFLRDAGQWHRVDDPRRRVPDPRAVGALDPGCRMASAAATSRLTCWQRSGRYGAARVPRPRKSSGIGGSGVRSSRASSFSQSMNACAAALGGLCAGCTA